MQVKLIKLNLYVFVHILFYKDQEFKAQVCMKILFVAFKSFNEYEIEIVQNWSAILKIHSKMRKFLMKIILNLKKRPKKC